MAQMQSLKALTKSSGRIATFAVRLSDGAVETYTYENKRTGQDVTAHKFETFLVGNNSQEYCKGYVKASKEECERAARRFKDGTVWALSKVVLDTFTRTQYINTPVQLRVDLSKSLMTAQDGDSEAHQELHNSMPSSPELPISVADVSRITTNRCTDLIAVIKKVSDKTRTSKTNELIVDLSLIHI